MFNEIDKISVICCIIVILILKKLFLIIDDVFPPLLVNETDVNELVNELNV